MNTKTLSIFILSSLMLVSAVLLATCSPISGAPVFMAQPVTFEENPVSMEGFSEAYNSTTWEINADDIAAARTAALYLAEKERERYEIGPADIQAAREAAAGLSQANTAGEVNFDAAALVSGELDASDILAARQAALYLAEKERARYEISLADIQAAREAAEALSQANAARKRYEISPADIQAAREAAAGLSK
jgi:hypothetical protein